MPEDDLADVIARLYEQAGEALRLLREQDTRLQGSGPKTAPLSHVAVPGESDPGRVHLGAVAESSAELRLLRKYFQNYADGIDPLPGSDPAMLAAADALRRLMEAVYQQPITFDGEERAADQDDVSWHDKLTQARKDASAAVSEDEKDAAVSEDEKDATTWEVRNLTAKPIDLTGPGRHPFVVPAFGSRKLKREPATTFDEVDELEAGDELEVKEIIPSGQTAVLVVLGLAFWVVPPFAAAALIWGDRSWFLIAIPAALAIVGLAYALGDPRRRESTLDAVQRVPRRATNLFSLLLVLFFAVVVPAVTIYLGADLHDVVERAGTGPLTDGGTDDLTLLARGLQLLFIAAASMLPGLLYFQFDRERLGTIWEKFTRHVFRLDDRVTTEAALIARYGFLMEEVFGRARPDRRGRLLPDKLSPIVVATLVFVLGWLLTLLNPQVGAISDQADLVSLFQPHQSAVTFAFLGAYVYALGALLRGYVRRDLRPKSYTDITVRIVTVVALAWLLQVFFPDDEPVLLVFAFATGLVPQIAFTLLREAIQSSGATGSGGRLEERWKRLWRRDVKDQPDSGQSSAPENLPVSDLDDPLPLTQLEGIDLYDRARLASEGITNIEALAHSDLIELLVQTRIPAPRLVDWVDQSILYLHVSRDDKDADNHSSYDRLRGVGIRNATDLLRASAKAEARGPGDKNGNAFMQILGTVQDGGPERLSIIIDAIEDEEWLSNLLYWRSQGDPDEATVQALERQVIRSRVHGGER